MSTESTVETARDKAIPAPARGVATLENLAAFAEDLNNQAISELGTRDALERAVRERFGPGVTLDEVTEVLDAVRGLDRQT